MGSPCVYGQPSWQLSYVWAALVAALSYFKTMATTRVAITRLSPNSDTVYSMTAFDFKNSLTWTIHFLRIARSS